MPTARRIAAPHRPLGTDRLDETRTSTGTRPDAAAARRPRQRPAAPDDPHAARPAAPPPEAEVATPIDFRLVRCLLADPRPYGRRLVKHALDVFDIRLVTEVESGSAVLSCLREAWFDVVLLDFHLPDLTGAEVTRQVRRAGTVWAEVPVIMVTSDTEPSRVLESRDAGIHEFLARPFSPADLFLRIAYTLQHPRPFVRTEEYVGPDRRWLDEGPGIGRRERRMMQDAEARGRKPYKKTR